MNQSLLPKPQQLNLKLQKQVNLQLEKKLNHKPKGLVVGVDEAGRGSWAGPVVAAAVAWPTSQPLPAGLNDSKMITPLGRERLFIEVAKQASAVGVGVATAIEVDELGVGQATRLAMRRAVQQLSGEIEVVLVDGFWVEFEGLNSVGVIGGDGACGSIAAASIVAKVTRDRMMVALDRQYAEFGFAKHKGYGTGSHQEAIALHGLCDEHRRSFAPIRKALI